MKKVKGFYINNIDALLAMCGRSRIELALYLGTNETQVSRWATGRWCPRDVHILHSMMLFFGVDSIEEIYPLDTGTE